MNSAPDRKRRTRGHIIADLSVNHVERLILQCGWTPQRISFDYGLDLSMSTFDPRGYVENGVVYFQLKASDSPRVVTSRDSIALRLDWRDVVFWLNEWMPIILVVYDARRDMAWWLYLQEGLRNQIRERGRRSTQRLTIYVPLANVLDSRAIRLFARFRDEALTQSNEARS
jgi:hypothetical protein